MQKNSFIFDFDSTLVALETLDTLIKQKASFQQCAEIDAITKACMNGEIDFHTSLTKRLAIAKINLLDIDHMQNLILNHLTEGIDKIICFLLKNQQNVFIISGGFLPIIEPIAKNLNISFKNCFANEFILNGNNLILKDNPLAFENGKQIVVQNLKKENRLTGKVIMIGDGMSDYRIFENKLADVFIGCGIHQIRPNVLQKAPYFITSTPELFDLIKKII